MSSFSVTCRVFLWSDALADTNKGNHSVDFMFGPLEELCFDLSVHLCVCVCLINAYVHACFDAVGWAAGRASGL